MQGMSEIVDRELYGVAPHRQASVVDAVGIPSYGSSEIGLVVLGIISLYAVEPEHHIAWLSIPAGHRERHDAATEIGHAYLHAVIVGQGVERYGLSVACV